MDLSPAEQREQLVAIQKSLVTYSKISVLIVDDSSDDAFVAKARLESFGITATVATDGDIACQMVKSEEFSIVFLDWMLSGKSGLETLKEIKLIVPDCVVVILTGATYGEYVSRALKFGALAIMLKPLEDEDIKFIFGVPNNKV
jgi:DNA-binding response OmpR family regulator